jgi:hypothetical protein
MPRANVAFGFRAIEDIDEISAVPPWACWHGPASNGWLRALSRIAVQCFDASRFARSQRDWHHHGGPLTIGLEPSARRPGRQPLSC